MIEDEAIDGPPPLRMWGKRPYAFPGEHIGSGNRCGHNPEQLATDRLALPPVRGGFRVQVLDELIERMRVYFSDPASVPLLAYLSKKKNTDGSYRQNRSEGREAQFLVGAAIFAALDLKSLRVGHYTTRGEFVNLSFSELALRAGLAAPGKTPDDQPVPSSRFWRAVAWLKRAGVIKVFEQYEETPEGKRGRPAIKTVSEKFIRSLGRFTKSAFKNARDKSSQALGKWLTEAELAGVQSKEDADELARQISSKRTRDELFPKPAIKNQQPKEILPDDSAEEVKAAYQRHVAAVYAKIAEALGRPARGKEAMKLFHEYGGLPEAEWVRRRKRE